MTKLLISLIFILFTVIANAMADGRVDMSPVKLKKGDQCTIECSEGDVKMVEFGVIQRLTSSIRFSIELIGHSSSDAERLFVEVKAVNAYDPEIAIEVSVVSSQRGVLARKLLTDNIPENDSPIFCRVTASHDCIDVALGNTYPAYALSVAEDFDLQRAVLSFDGGACTVTRRETASTRLPRVNDSGVTDFDAILTDNQADSHTAKWIFFDEDTETRLSKKGGAYTLLTIPASEVMHHSGEKIQPGEYTIIYLDGARTLANKWHPGAIKGTLHPTPFQSTYSLTWIGPDGAAIDDPDAYATFSDSFLTLTFPRFRATLRFARTQ